MIRDHLIDQHQEFYPLLPMAVLGAVDGDGDVWATLRAGLPGFLHSPDPGKLSIELERDFLDPAETGMDDASSIALLGIDLRTRRRNRLNGMMHRRAGGFDISVSQSFGNCPKYIQVRQPRFLRDPQSPSISLPRESSLLAGASRALVERTDVFFVATYVRLGRTQQVDVSHRGGRAGFIHVGEDGWLTIPDFSGNRFFNTLGNISLNPRAGLVVPDFLTGGLLQMTGAAELVRDVSAIRPVEGAERYWRFRSHRIIWRADALPLLCDEEEVPPRLP